MVKKKEVATNASVIEKLTGNEPKSVTGTAIQSGRIYEEYLDSLKTSRVNYAVYDKMRRSDTQIQRLVVAIKTPIIGAKFAYSPKDSQDKDQLRQAEFKTAVINEFMTKNLQETLTEIITFLWFGHAEFEPVYYVRDDKKFGKIITLQRLQYIKQCTVYEWVIEQGEVKKIRQLVFTGDVSVDQTIDATDFLIFTNQKEGDNFEGVSIFRPCYGAYTRKDLFYKIDMIGNEKMALGTPVVFAPDSIRKDKKELEELQDVLENFAAHENASMILPDGLKGDGFMIVKGEYNSEAISKSINREDMSILASSLLSFLEIGTQRGGGNAQSETLYQMFIDSIDHIASYICEKLDVVAHKVYVMNFGEPDVHLKMSASGLIKKNPKEIMDVLTGYAKASMLTPDENIEAKIRVENDLPPHDIAAVKKEPPAPKDKKPVPQSKLSLSDRRELTEYEKAINLDAIDTLLSSSETKYKEIVQQYLEKAKGKYLADLKTALTNTNKTKSIMAIKIGFMSQLQDELRAFLNEVGLKARKQAGTECNAVNRLEDTGFINNWSGIFAFKLKKIIAGIESKLEDAATFAAIGAVGDALTDSEVIATTLTAIDRFVASASTYQSAGAIVNEVVNTERNNFFFKNADLIQGFQFSAVLDGKTTLICASLDGKTFKIGDADGLEFRPPLHWFCRSILVPILIEQEAPEWTGLQPTEVQGKTIDEIIKQKQF
jgi:SPP1 gp7 family putative phage head morphogenesis protein